MISRRDALKSAVVAGVAASVASPAQAQEKPTEFVTFNKDKQFELPSKAFSTPLPIPLVPRPTAVGEYRQIAEQPYVFGEDDPVAIGACFHGVADEFSTTPKHWEQYGCNSSWQGEEAWNDKCNHFKTFEDRSTHNRIANWGGFPIKCYKIPIVETYLPVAPDAMHKTRLYAYAGMVPGPTLKMRIGQPVVIRYVNHLDTETSVHLHGGHNPSHSDGFPTFYVLQGKSRDYFYPNILPMYENWIAADGTRLDKPVYEPDEGEAQSTMWYHDHAMDATAYNVSKGLAGFAPCMSEAELDLIRRRVLPGLAERSCFDPEQWAKSTDPSLEHPDHPGFYDEGKEPYYNPYDLPLAIQDKVIDPATGQIVYDTTGHNGYLGDTMFVNGASTPLREVENRKYRLRLLNGCNARVLRLRLLKASDFWRLHRDGIDDPGTGQDDPAVIARRPQRYDRLAQPYLRIGKDSWLWPKALTKKQMVLAMANRGDIVVDFSELVGRDLAPGESEEFVLVNTMPQTDGRGPKQKLDDGGDPRVLPLPFDEVEFPIDSDEQLRIAESRRPIGLMMFRVTGAKPHQDDEATIKAGDTLVEHKPIGDDEVSVVREFIFERGKGAWQINGRFYDPMIANATPTMGSAEEWVLRNGGGGWWHPIHIHLESHQLVRYEKDFGADEIVDRGDPPAARALADLDDITERIDSAELQALHDTTVLGPNTVARIRMRFRTWRGPFVFHCHNLEHEDMRMMFNFEPVADGMTAHARDPNVVPDARTHGSDVTLHNAVGELPFEVPAVPKTPVRDSKKLMIPKRPRP